MNPPPYNTGAPYTAADIERFNRFTHFPKSVERENAKFAEASKQERDEAAARLNVRT